MNDEFDDLINDAKLTYNVPPAVPREAMWEAISRARAAAAVAPIAAARQGQRWISAAAGIAAVLVVGIAIGRASKEPQAAPATVASTTATTPSAGIDSGATAAASGSSVGYGPGASLSRPPSTVRRERAQGAAEGSSASQSANDRGADQTAYRLAVVEHLTRTEVLLTGFRAQARSGGDARVDAQFASLSRELLGTTRLLIATRRGDDPAITRLLEDLELILMQLSQYAADGRRTDLDAINQSLEKRNVLPKLRSTIPAGVSASAGTE